MCDIKVDGWHFFFFCATILSVSIRTEETLCLTHSLPWNRIAPNSWRNSSTWATCGLARLRRWCAAAASRPAIAPSQTTQGHDPQFRLTRRVAGKTVTESFANPQALRKAQQEVAEFHRFQQLSEELVDLNAKICTLRPVEQERGGWTEQEKKRLLRSIRRWHER